MPLRRKSNSQVEYSANSSNREQYDEKNAASSSFEELLAELGVGDDVVAESEIPDDMVDALTDGDRSKNVPHTTVEKCPADASKNVRTLASKNVPSQKHRSASKDDKILRKVRGFVPGSGSAGSSSLVSSLLCPLTTPVVTPLTTIATTPATPPKPANDNLIPVWERTGDLTKAVFATLALQIAEDRPVAFNFNLTPEAIADALGHSSGFLDRLKRAFDKELEKAGVELSYWFAVDVDDDGRLHLHGAFGLPAINLSVLGTLRRIRKLMKESWGKWSGPGNRKQLRFKNVYSDDWATYCMRNRAKVRKIIGCRTYTINQSLRREAKAAYDSARDIMRGKI